MDALKQRRSTRMRELYVSVVVRIISDIRQTRDRNRMIERILGGCTQAPDASTLKKIK